MKKKKEKINNELVQENIENNNFINKEENIIKPLKLSVNVNEVENILEVISDKQPENNNNEIPARNL